MQELLGSLTQAVEGTPALALAASFVWGVLSLVLSPCHLASIPLVVGFVSGEGRTTTRRAFLASLVFAGGILLTIGAVGVITASLGRIMGHVGGWVNYLVAGVLLLVGLQLLDVISLPWVTPGGMKYKGQGLLGALVLGLVFGIAVGPCTFAYMAPMLAVVFRTAGAQPAFAVLLLLAYGVGHSCIIVAGGTAAGWVQKYLDWDRGTSGRNLLKKLCGALVLVGGLYLLYQA